MTAEYEGRRRKGDPAGRHERVSKCGTHGPNVFEREL
jgi:hypothetical protein